MVGLTLEAEGLRAAVGSRCLVINDDSYHPTEVEAEVMGFSSGKLYLMPVGSLAGIAPARGSCRWSTPDACPWACPCSVARCWARPGWQGRHARRGLGADGWSGDQPAQAPSHQRTAGCRHPQHQWPAHGRRGQRLGLLPARVSVSRAAGHDDALHRGRHHRRRADR